MERDGTRKSIWQDIQSNYSPKNKADKKIIYDVIIIGCGITGLSVALLLQNSGLKCLLIEAKNLGFGTTGGTTAHINTFFDTTYDKIESNFGAENAQLSATAAAEAKALIKSNIKKYSIDCDFKEIPGYLFSVDDKQTKELETLVEAAKKVGVEVNYINDTPISVPYIKIYHFADQAQFHPLKYLLGLAKAFEEAGGTIFQNCRVIKTEEEENDAVKVYSEDEIFSAKKVIYATHIPPGINLLHMRCVAWRSYAMAIKLNDEKYPDAALYDMCDPYHYYRTQIINNEKFLIAGGEDHKTAHEKDTLNCFNNLENYLRNYFDIKEIPYKWSAQYFEPADGIPYIGHLPGSTKNVFVATGFGGNGMMYSQIAAITLHDMIVKGKSKYEKLYDPNRIKPIAGFSGFVSEAADVTIHLVKSLFPADKIKELSEISNDEARVIKYEGKTIALYKDGEGNIHGVNPACTHMKCSVEWNNAERSWDCPCHGSRFDIDGNILTGPATKNLEVMEINSTENSN